MGRHLSIGWLLPGASWGLIVTGVYLGSFGCGSSPAETPPPRFVPSTSRSGQPEAGLQPTIAEPASSGRVSQTPSPTASVSAPTTPLAPVLERLPEIPRSIRNKLDAAQRLKLEIAASICPAAVLPGPKGLRVGCRSRPPYDQDKGPDGRILTEGGMFDLEQVVRGSFSAPNQDEAAVVVQGGEPVGGRYGGILLVSLHHDNVWQKKGYYAGFDPSSCEVLKRPDSHDLLVCRWSYAHQNIWHDVIQTFDFTGVSPSDIEPGVGEVVDLVSDFVGGCLEWPHPSQPSYVVSRIRGFTLDSTAPDRAITLTVKARGLRMSPKLAAYRARCRALNSELAQANPRHVDMLLGLPLKPLELRYVWDGQSFVATEQTTTLLHRLYPEEPEAPRD